MKPFAAVFAGDGRRLTAGLIALNGFFGGEPDVMSPAFPVVETAYYEKEMGPGLVKVYASWPRLMAPGRLVEVKLAAMAWERRNSPQGRREANLDPGYISVGGLVLSTGKFRGHRLYLGHGLWGELTLSYHKGAFQPFPWTYQDYVNPEVQSCLLKMRKIYMEQRLDLIKTERRK
jgi:hypothetical protein